MNFLAISRLCHLIFQKTEGVSYRETLYLIVIYCEIEKLRVIKQTENFYFEYGFHWCSKNVLWPACVIGVPRVKRKRQTHSGVYKAPSSYYIYIYIYTHIHVHVFGYEWVLTRAKSFTGYYWQRSENSKFLCSTVSFLKLLRTDNFSPRERYIRIRTFPNENMAISISVSRRQFLVGCACRREVSLMMTPRDQMAKRKSSRWENWESTASTMNEVTKLTVRQE